MTPGSSIADETTMTKVSIAMNSNAVHLDSKLEDCGDRKPSASTVEEDEEDASLDEKPEASENLETGSTEEDIETDREDAVESDAEATREMPALTAIAIAATAPVPHSSVPHVPVARYDSDGMYDLEDELDSVEDELADEDETPVIQSFRPFQHPRRSDTVSSNSSCRTIPYNSARNVYAGHSPMRRRTDDMVPILLLSLPVDALHTIAGFSEAKDWAHLGQSSRGAHRACREVFRRVQMHAFRCASEVVHAWSRGEHADARELAALYLKNGVPIYPAPNGHAYHTLKWRMGLEIRTMDGVSTEPETPDGGQTAEASPPSTLPSAEPSEESPKVSLDPFYRERHDPRDRDRHQSLTYVEEKTLFLKRQEGIDERCSVGRRHSMTTAGPLRTHAFRGWEQGMSGVSGAAGAGMAGTSMNDSADSFARARRSNSMDLAGPSLPFALPCRALPDRGPKVTVKIHRHLADQHLFGIPAVRDDNGNMNAGPANLNADFFHPHWGSPRQFLQSDLHAEVRPNPPSDAPEWNDATEDYGLLRAPAREDYGMQRIPSGQEVQDIGDTVPGMTRSANSHMNLFPYFAAASALATSARAPLHGMRRNSMHSSSSATARSPYDPPSWWNFSPASDVSLEIYSTSAYSLADDESPELDDLRVRCTVYQRKLDSFLAQHDPAGFEECLLDFWDEIFPSSAGIHFYNRQSPVPRMSRLKTFLTTPCPKSIGIVQCEIVRVKISPKSKGVNMKKRLFPSYEYRLFIRDVKNDNPHSLSNVPPRKDSVLLVAKGRGRKNKHSNDAPSTPNSKRGANNYYMCLPQQRDVDLHFKSANSSHSLPAGHTSGLAVSPQAAKSNSPVELGRLQSNFIGTEFQIFLPTMAKHPRRRSSLGSPSSDEDTDGEQLRPSPHRRASMDATTRPTRRGSGFARFARRASLTRMARRGSMTRDEDTDAEEDRMTKATRRMSWGPSLPNKKSNRTNRRAIANSADSDGSSSPPPLAGEEECGAITYTANLLGNRPRIMDVCIPRLMEDGTASTEWRKFPEHSPEGDLHNRMLDRFKSIQQQMEHTEGHQPPEHETIEDDHGLMILQNRPPWWNMELGAFVLNFGGRVSVASVKNFQLCERSNQEYIMLQFGRIQGRHAFTMDFQYPLTPVQAFAIAISSLQSKISFG